MNAVSDALWVKLSGGTALTALLSGTAAVYHQQAGASPALPYVVYNKQGGGPDNLTQADLRNLLYLVRGYGTSADQAGSIDGALEALLHRGTLSVDGYTAFQMIRESDAESVETQPNGEKVFMAGAVYRIRMTGQGA